jgi:tetratricopeptide (TPR) repeat protein
MTSGWRVGVVLAVLIAVAYGESLRNDFVFDDTIFMRHDPRVRSVEGFRRLFVEPLWGFADEGGRRVPHQYYRPLQLLPLVLSNLAFGGAAWPCQLLDLLLHLGNALLAFALFRRLAGAAAAPAAALFAVHPGYSEGVLWVANFAGLGSVAATLAILLLHASGAGRGWGGRVAIAVLFLAGLWCKETAVLAPVLVVLHDLLLDRERRGWRRLAEYAVYLPPFALYAALRLHALGGWVPGLRDVALGRRDLALNAVALVPEYVRGLLWPTDPNLYHDFDAIHAPTPAFWWGALAVAALATGVAATWRRRPVVAFGLLWAAVATAPQLVVRWPRLNPFAERYLYLPAIGMFLVVACVPARRAALVAVPLLALAVAGDRARTRDWRDEVTLFTKTLAQSPGADLIRNNLAVRYLDLGRFEEGVAVASELVRRDPTFPRAAYNLGLLQLGRGDDAAALAAFERATEADPLDPKALLDLGYLYDRVGRREEAVATYLGLVDVDPRSADGWYNLAAVALEGGQYGNARRAVARVLAVAPGDEKAGALGARLAALPAPRRASGAADAPDTVRRCEEARRLADAERDAEAVRALGAAAWLDEASALPHHYLANVHYLHGRLLLAAQAEREALLRAPANRLYRRNLASLRRAVAAVQAR